MTGDPRGDAVVFAALGAILLGWVAVLLYAARGWFVGWAISALFRHGDVEEARRWVRAARLLRPDAKTARALDTLELQCAEVDGDTEAIRTLAPRLAERGRAARDFSLGNTAINALINAGLYREALEVGEGWRPEEGIALRWLVSWRLMQVNLAEAEYNLGRWDEAWRRLQALSPEREPSPFIASSIRLQRAWILAQWGAGDEALALAERIDREAIPPLYWAEVCFTRAAAQLARGALDKAEEELDQAARLARRASSRRNLRFLEARLRWMQGRTEEAERLCAEAAASHYRGQGGAGLLLWGELLEELGRHEAAREAWARVLERDPQSEAAALARARLGERGGGGDPIH